MITIEFELFWITVPVIHLLGLDILEAFMVSPFVKVNTLARVKVMLVGKLVEMVCAGVISETVSKQFVSVIQSS